MMGVNVINMLVSFIFGFIAGFSLYPVLRGGKE